MKVWNATEDQIREALDVVSLKVYGEWTGHSAIEQEGRALRFRLAVDKARPRDENGFLPYQRHSTWRETNRKPRKIAAVCWHGHRDFMRALFAIAPEARIKTALADYRGAADFEAKFRSTQGHGNNWNLSYEQACGCGVEIRRAA